MEETLSNANLEQLPKGGFIEPDDLLVFRSKLRGVTYSIPAKDLVPIVSSNFQWIPGHEYDEDEVVTYNGLWWQSQQDVNTGHTPGTEGDDWWVAVPKAVGFDWWTAGVYAEENPVVLSDYTGFPAWYRLVDATRPYVSTNLEEEVDNGDWKLFASNDVSFVIENEPDDVMIDLDCKHFSNVTFYVTSAMNTTWEFMLSNADNLQNLTINFAFDVEDISFFLPNTFYMSDAGWNPGSHAWTQADGSGHSTGRCMLHATKAGIFFYVNNFITQLI